MRAIVVDDEEIMLKSFLRLSKDVKDLNVIGTFAYAEDALEFAETNTFELAILDIELPGVNGIECAKKLRQKMPEILIVFISAYDNYLRDSNQIGGDDYILKPYKTETIERMMDRMRLLVRRQEKDIYVQMFGPFTVFRNGKPVPLSGKAKEILALVMVQRGKEISNREIYETIWETREYSNEHMKVYFNALKRLKDALGKNGLSDLLLSTPHGQIANTKLFDCDYYSWQDHNMGSNVRFEGEFLSEYSWGEFILGGIINDWI